MKRVYRFIHRHFVEIDMKTGEEVYNTMGLGYFSSEEKCLELIPFYLELPGFKDYPNAFIIEEVEADVDYFNDEIGNFEGYVYELSHEYYDGEYDNVSFLGFYSTLQNAERAERKFRLDEDFVNYPEGFCISKYEIDKKEWTEGFFTWD